MTRAEAETILRAIAKLVETTEEQGDYSGCDDSGGSFWQSDVGATLNYITNEVRGFKRG